MQKIGIKESYEDLNKISTTPDTNKIMANTFSQIYLQFIFAVKQRQSLIPVTHKEELHRYITGLVLYF